jgi:hypothetical protein
MRFGRKRPVARAPRLRLSNYLLAHALPPGPPACDWSPSAEASLSNILGNDTLGDCVVAGGYHVVGVETGNAGKLFVPTLAQVIADYSAIGGYVPGEPDTDQGCDEETAINYWTHHGFANGTKLLGAVAIDPSSAAEIEAACFLFENLVFCAELRDAWVNPMPRSSGFVWPAAGNPDPDNGHCFVASGYGPGGVTIATWGMLGTITVQAIAEYCSKSANGSLYVYLTPDQLMKGVSKAPNGVDWAQLVADFDAIGGTAPLPVIPPPTPAPPAPSPVAASLADAQKWASAGLAASWPK